MNKSSSEVETDIGSNSDSDSGVVGWRFVVEKVVQRRSRSVSVTVVRSKCPLSSSGGMRGVMVGVSVGMRWW